MYNISEIIRHKLVTLGAKTTSHHACVSGCCKTLQAILLLFEA